MKILLLGANGQVGFELHRSLAPVGEIVPATRTGVLPGGAPCEISALDDGASLEALVARTRPDWVVNAAAYTAVDRAEDDEVAAARANGDAPGVIGRAASRIGAAVLHFSTDYVFDGAATTPYREDDPTAPLGAYGRSKLAGEQALAASGAKHLVFRTAWVYGARGQNFLRTMLRLAAERDRLKVVSDQRGAPTPARLLADVAAHAVTRLGCGARDGWGVHHVAARGETSWHGFAQAIVDAAAEAGLLERAPEVVAIRSEDFPTRARRPAYSVLDPSRIETLLGLRMPPWRDGVVRCIAEIAESRR